MAGARLQQDRHHAPQHRLQTLRFEVCTRYRICSDRRRVYLCKAGVMSRPSPPYTLKHSRAAADVVRQHLVECRVELVCGTRAAVQKQSSLRLAATGRSLTGVSATAPAGALPLQFSCIDRRP